MTNPATFDSSALPLDPTSVAALAAQGLSYEGVDPGEEGSAPFLRWVEAVDRGFISDRSPVEAAEAWRRSARGSRIVAIRDPGSPFPDLPVATLRGWLGELTVDVGRTLPSWGISAVTVSSTHRRRGIARALLEGELRAAADAGVAVASLTVSEATIYGRYGFGPAAGATRWTIDARRAGWIGPQPVREGRGRIDIVDREAIETDARALLDRIRLTQPGEFEPTPAMSTGLAGLFPGRPSLKVRGVRYTDADGATRGLLVYSLAENPDDYRASTLTVNALLAETPDAYAALWHYALSHDLVGTVKASELSLDEPLRWQVADQRALAITEHDHHWLRILDVPAALSARGYRAPGTLVLDVVDPVGIAGGTFRLEVDDDGEATVTRVDDAAGPALRLGIDLLSALYLGGVSARTLLAAGRIQGAESSAAWFDTAFAPLRTPRLSYWY